MADNPVTWNVILLVLLVLVKLRMHTTMFGLTTYCAAHNGTQKDLLDSLDAALLDGLGLDQSAVNLISQRVCPGCNMMPPVPMFPYLTFLVLYSCLQRKRMKRSEGAVETTAPGDDAEVVSLESDPVPPPTAPVEDQNC